MIKYELKHNDCLNTSGKEEGKNNTEKLLFKTKKPMAGIIKIQ